jgi:site-specific DNA-methyltransferase (adenine-specific)
MGVEDSMRLIHGDCLIEMAKLPDKSVDLTVTSPPYDKLRTFNGCFVFDFDNIAKELLRVTKDGGVLVWIINDETVNCNETGTSFKQALYFKEIGFNLHDTMIWQKANPIPKTHNKVRYMASFDYMFVLSKGKPKTVNLIREPCIQKQAYTSNASWGREKNGTFKKGNNLSRTNETKIKKNVWVFAIGNKTINHPAVFPEKLAKDHIITWSNKNDLVLDPFMGSGTTGIACHNLDRDFIGIELNKEYFDIATKRINDARKQQRITFDKKPESVQLRIPSGSAKPA